MTHHLKAVNSAMEKTSRAFRWSSILDEGTDDSEQMDILLKDVMIHVTLCLSETDLKDHFISFGNDPMSILADFSADEMSEWKTGIEKGVKDRDWADLIAHPKLQAPATNTGTIGVPICFQHVVAHAWSAEYRGKSAQSLLQSIDNVHNQPVEKRYAKLITMIQSSGTGKSKTVDEISKTRILFPLCLREDIGSDYFAYPPVDIRVRNYLLEAPSAADEMECKSHLSSFISSLFSEAQIQIQEFAKDAAGRLKYGDLAWKFYKFFSDKPQRDAFYMKVLEGAPSSRNLSLTSTLKSLLDTLKNCSDWPGTLVSTFCPILQSMDEVHVLFLPRPLERHSVHTLYSRLKSVLSEMNTEAFCTIFLSTTSIVSAPAPSKDVPPSMCVRGDKLVLPPPFTELPFDVDLLSEPLVPAKASISSVGSLKFTVQFGRPLFAATYRSLKSQGDHDRAIAHSIMEIVLRKLCGFEWPPEKPAVLDASSIAVLSARLLLDLSPSTSRSRKLEEDQVRSHLRMLYSVQRSHQVLVTGSSPEPLIAEASAITMHHLIKDGLAYMDIWGLLRSFIDEGLMPQGTIGELIGRVLSIIAMDRAIEALPHQELRPLKYQTPITVTAYYKALLSDDAWEKLRLSVPINRRDLCQESAISTFEDAFAGAYLHFSHYAKASDDTPFNDQYTWALWLRGTAVLGQLNQHLTDRGLPIHFPTEGYVQPESMSVIFDQDKTGESEDPTFVKAQSAETLKIFSSTNKLPYIDAVHCYALTSRQGITVTTPSSSHDITYNEDDLAAPRYRIDIRGLAVYRDISPGLADVIRAMIDGTKEALYAHHPSPDALPLLRQMQPLLNAKKDTTAWFGGFKQR